jgi:hypothetical protein
VTSVLIPAEFRSDRSSSVNDAAFVAPRAI